MPSLHALGLSCSLKRSDAPSSTDVLVSQVLGELAGEGVAVDGPVRVADLDVRPGVSSDEGPGDDWPDLRRRILDADILVFGTPIWLGQPSSVAKRVTERMDARRSTTWASRSRRTGTDYKDLEKVPDAVASATATAARDAAHLAGLLAAAGYPPAS